jgi:hypothetical protein
MFSGPKQPAGRWGDSNPQELKADETRMLGIASRVPETLRFNGWRGDFCVVVSNFSDLVSKHGESEADKLVFPVEMAVAQQGWTAVRKEASIKEQTVMQIVAQKPKNSPPEME